jgi:hypothetical protein
MNMNQIAIVAALMLVTVTGCSKRPSAADVCKKLEASGVAASCRTDSPNGLGAAASEKVSFDLPSVPGKTGAVFGFASADSYKSTTGAFEGAAMLAGPHRYGSEKALIFVQMNSGATPDVGGKAKAVVEAL